MKVKGEKITITTTRSLTEQHHQESRDRTNEPHKCMCGVAIPESCDMCRDCFDILYPNAPHAEPKPKRAYTKRQKPGTAVSPAVQKARGGFRPRYISPDKRKGGEK